MIKAPAEVCPLCEGTGWKTVPSSRMPAARANDRRVTRCDCQLRARAQSLLAAARIPRRYEHCELTNYDTDFPGAHPSLAEAHFVASNFAKKCDPRGDKGLLIIGKIGTGKTHLAVGIIKDLILNRGISPVLRLSGTAEGNSELLQLDGSDHGAWTFYGRYLTPTSWCSTNSAP